MIPPNGIGGVRLAVGRAGGVVGHTGGNVRTTLEVFEEIFLVFLVLGTLVGVVVISYMLYNAVKYRAGADRGTDADRPVLGELPQGGGGGKKLFVSFAISAVIVVGLVGWTYSALLYVEEGPDAGGEELEVGVEGYRFSWEFVYPNGHSEHGTLRVPVDTKIELTVTSDDVWHTFGSPDLKVKTDAIPGQTSETWFIANETGEYDAACYELCGSGHSTMTATIVVVDQEEFDEWYAGTDAEENSTDSSLAEPRRAEAIA